MKMKLNDFQATKETLQSLDAPVYVKRVNRYGKVALVRRRSCTQEQVEEFFAVHFFMKDFEQNERSTNSERNVSEP